ncbi:uncharacterized protein ACNLHF_009962 isoform 2-T2 [Anomaloglossus baeobatrachus]|uniref:uncharacterized protein LOC142292364 isoform X2 n=1 Tax=Anomaloglossus baeobatrachus TaxID=238106 RepID=UPI003F50CAA7
MSQLPRPPQVPVQTPRSCQSLTGCFYQVVQSTGPQGTNVLNLLPILRPNFKPPPAAPPLLPPSAPALHVPPAVVASPAPPASVVSRPSPVTVPLVQTPTLGNYFISTQGSTLHVENQLPVYKEATLLLDRGQLTLPANSVPGNPPTFIMVNTKPTSPIKPLPSGHSLQIPAHAEVISVPVSSLPASIQQKILPQASVSGASKIPSVIYVSPVNTVKAGNARSAQPDPSPETKSPPLTVQPSEGSQANKGPMKWVVQENQESASCLVPVKSSNDTASKILQMLTNTKMENVTNPDHSKVQIKENALVMCNNKIFFLTKKGTEILNAGAAKIPEPPLHATPSKPATEMKPTKELSNKVVQVVLAKNNSPPKESLQSNVISTAKPKRKSSTPRAFRDDTSALYSPGDSGSNVWREQWGTPSRPTTTTAVSTDFAVSTPAARTTAVYTPAARTTAVYTPAARTTAVYTPAARTTAVYTPAARTTAVYTPAARTTAVYTPAARTTAVYTPAARTTTVYTPATRTSGGGTTAASTSGLNAADARTSSLSIDAAGTIGVDPAAIRTSAVSTPAARTSAVSTPAARTSAVSIPAARTSAVSIPAARTSAVSASAVGNAWISDQPLPESQKTEIAAIPQTPEGTAMDENSWRLKYGLLKEEKIILKRLPLIGAKGTSAAPVETEKNQLKRKSSQTEDDTKMQKRWDSGDINQNSLDPEVSADPPSPASGVEDTHESDPTWSYHDPPNPPDTADFQVSQDTAGHFSNVLLPSARFHIDSKYSDETTKDEKIQRLKEVLKERENALEELRRQTM